MQSRTSPTKVSALRLTISCTIAALFFVINLAMLRVVSAFREMFDDIGGELPALTQLVVSLPGPVWVAGGFVGGVAFVAKDFVLGPRSRDFVNGAALLSVPIYVFGLVISLFLPLVKGAQMAE